jgi:hypothetical protein
MYIFYTNYLINVVESHGIIFYTGIILELFRLKRKFIWYSIVRTNATDLTNEDFDKKNKYDINHLFIFYKYQKWILQLFTKKRHSSFVVNNSMHAFPILNCLSYLI